MAAIRVRGLTKRYRDRTVVDNLDFEVPDGSVAGLVGPAGAGKTTTLRMLLGRECPDGGHGQILGEPMHQPDRYLPRTGALLDWPAFDPDLSGPRNLELLGARRDRVLALFAQAGLADRAGDPYHTYSQGMRLRLGLAAALLRDPELVLLDQPAAGLGSAALKQLLAGHRTILLATHQLTGIQQLCDWLIVIDNGRLVYQGPTAELSSDELILGTEHAADLNQLQALLTRRGLPSVRIANRLRVGLADLKAMGGQHSTVALIAGINRAAAAAGLALTELSVQRRDLEETVMRLRS
jgi:ABC-2 type transport system ATP-binding protein